MQWRRAVPASLLASLMILVVALKTRDAGGISREAIAVLLIFFIGILSIVILSTPEKDEVAEVSNSHHSEKIQTNDSQPSESSLPDPLDEGFDSPLM